MIKYNKLKKLFLSYFEVIFMKKLMLLLLTLATLISSSCTVIDKTPVGSLLFTSVRKSFYCSSGAITSAIKPIERDDPNYAKSTWCRRIQLNDEQYYQEKGSFLFISSFSTFSIYPSSCTLSYKSFALHPMISFFVFL